MTALQVVGARKEKAQLLSWTTSSKPLLQPLEILPADGTYIYREPL